MFEVVSLDFGGTIAHEAKEDYVVYCEVLRGAWLCGESQRS